MRLEVVATPFLKLVEKIGSPILVVHFETVAEDGVRGIRAKRLHQSIADVFQVLFCRLFVEMIENITFRANSGTLDLHSRPAGNKKENFIWRLYFIRQPDRSVMYLG